MKTIKIVLIAVMMIGFSSRAINGQARIFKGTVQLCAYIDCCGEICCGEISFNGVENKNTGIWNEKSNFIGQSTGTVYHVTNLLHWQTNKVLRQEAKDCAVSQTYLSTFLMHADGKIIAKFQIVIHVTLNANGETTASVEHEGNSIECY